jgi:hypothetical protein
LTPQFSGKPLCSTENNNCRVPGTYNAKVFKNSQT